MSKRILKLTGDLARRAACRHVMEAPVGHVVTLAAPTRTLDQNALLWPLLQEVADQVVWYGTRLTKEEWKDVFSAVLRKQKAVPGIEGGFVVCGLSTSRFSKQEFSELIELIHAFGAERGVVFSGGAKVQEAA